MGRIKHIDGLRAVSILCVLLYHTFPSSFPNGYLGIDYFLVISGFVISRKYFTNPMKYFSLRDFWSKRFSRLFPQLIFCIALCLPIAWFTMHPDHLENFSQSSIATLFGANNILLNFTGGYWNPSNDLKPLFTTWSLGLEEQFYFVIPLIFVISHKYFKPETFQKIFFTIFISSIITCGFGTLYFSKANYLLLPSRLWEFGVGIYAAYIVQKKPVWVTNFLTNLSFFSIILISLAIPIKTSLYAPNPLLIFPLSAISIICISENSSISTKLLSSKAFVYTGLSSYAIYLYHQPLLAFARLQTLNEIKLRTSLILFLFSLLIGFTMYELIEKKQIYKLFGKKSLVLMRAKSLLISTIILGIINITIVLNNGFFSLRFPYLLVDGKPPLGFLGGKEYTDHPYIYQSGQFSTNDNKGEKRNNSETFNIYLQGNSTTRDLINALKIIDDKDSKIKFKYSYKESFRNSKANKRLLEKADLIIVQIENWVNEKTIINDDILEEFGNYSDKLLWHKSREKFAKNITPIIFIKNIEERSNFKYNSIDSYHCNKKDVLSNKFEPNNSALGIIDTQCAFNDRDGLKILTSNKGELYSFDGVHLTLAGATELAQNLLSSQKFKKIIKF